MTVGVREAGQRVLHGLGDGVGVGTPVRIRVDTTRTGEAPPRGGHLGLGIPQRFCERRLSNGQQMTR